jgi:hypothetical protein
MGWTYNTYGRVERCTQVLMVIPEGKWKLGINMRIILKLIFKE